MKIITASTPEQQEYVMHMTNHLYQNIFPYFFNKDHMASLHHSGVMNAQGIEEYSLQDILEVTAALQTIEAVLECLLEGNDELHHAERFEENRRILEKRNWYFPFYYTDFKESLTGNMFRQVKPDNDWIL